MPVIGPNGEELWGGAEKPDDGTYGPSPEQVKKIADQIMDNQRRFNSAGDAPPGGKRVVNGPNGVPQGYGKYGDWA